MITLGISFVKFQKGKPLWKHNNSLLHDEDYLQIIKDKISEIKKQYAVPVYKMENNNIIPDEEIQFTINDQLFLDTLLMQIRGKLISYSSHKRKRNRIQRKRTY